MNCPRQVRLLLKLLLIRKMLLKSYFTPFPVSLLVYCGSEGLLCTMIQVLNPPPCRPVQWYKFFYFAAVLCISFSDQTECFE
jgi:hypothetical protein